MSLPQVKMSMLDRAIAAIAPGMAVERLKARTTLAMVGAFTGARKDRRQTMAWTPNSSDADTAILGDLATLRERSADLEYNSPLATGAIATKVTSVVGTGLKPRASIDRDVLTGLSEEQADAWERQAELEFRLATGGKDFDLARGHSFGASTELVYRSVLSRGGILVNLPRKPRPGNPYTLRAEFIEIDRVCNPQGKSDTATLTAGVEKDSDGAPIRYHVAKFHPGNMRMVKNREWQILEACDKSGRPTCLHIFKKRRPGQTHGFPDLAPVIELLKQISKYTDNEIDAAVVSSLFTVFVKSASGNPNISMPGVGGQPQKQNQIDTQGLELGSGNIVGLMKDEDVVFADPKRPNTSAGVFLEAMAEQVGVALELPKELLVKHFTASYSAAQAALLEAWRYFHRERAWLVEEYCQPIWDAVIAEAVARGRLSAPGFFVDPLVRMAYCGCKWTGDAKGQINEGVAVDAAASRVEAGFSTIADETAALTGGDWERNHRQQVKEKKARDLAGLTALATPASAPPAPMPQPNPDDEAYDKTDLETTP
jgi:lambda family phage portal protein